MTCKDIHEQITAYVDNRVDEAEYRAKMQQHIKQCSECRAAYEMELLTKTVVHQHSRRAEAPESLRAAIAGGMEEISREQAQAGVNARTAQPRREEGLLDRFLPMFTSPVGIAVAVLLIAVALARIVPAGGEQAEAGSPRATPKLERNIPAGGPEYFTSKASDNFQAVVQGKLGLQHTTSDCDDLSGFFQRKGVKYPVVCIPTSMKLSGGVVSEHGATRYAHLVYSSGNIIAYVFEVPNADLQKGDIVFLSSDVANQLESGKVYWEDPGNAHLALFKHGDVVCAVVSNAPRKQMAQLLAMN